MIDLIGALHVSKYSADLGHDMLITEGCLACSHVQDDADKCLGSLAALSSFTTFKR